MDYDAFNPIAATDGMVIQRSSVRASGVKAAVSPGATSMAVWRR